MDRVEILGVSFDNVTMAKALAHLEAVVQGEKPEYIVTPNPEMVYACYQDPSLYPLLRDAGLCVPDGIGVIYASRILGTPLSERVPGIELGEALIKWASENGKRVFLLGAKPGIAEQAGEKLREKYPGLVIAGTHDGYFKEDPPVAAQIRQAQADIAFVCMGFPRQEKFMRTYLEESGAKLMLGLGGSLDVFAGTVNRAPDAFNRLGLEWFYRLLKEPRRIGRMMKLPAFLFTVIGRKLTKADKREVKK